jgi:hypothetical protein
MRPATASALFFTCVAFAGAALAENEWVRVKGGSWEPTDIVFADMKKALEPFMKDQAKLQARELRKWREYTIQYQGVEEKGRKYVFINALCRPDPRWKLEDDFQMVHDGGSCYFHLKYDPTRRQFADLIINGEA